MRQTKITPMVEGGVLSAVAIIFALISVYLPVLGTFVNLIWPVPIILLGVRHGLKWSILCTVVAGLIIGMLMHPLQAVGVVVGFGLIGIVLGYSFRAGFSPIKVLLLGTAASFVSKGAVLLIATAVMGVNPLTTQTEILSGAVDQALGIYRSMGMTEEYIQETESMMKKMLDLMKLILPVAFLVASVIDTYINFLASKVVLKKLGHTIADLPLFKYWDMPKQIIWFYGASLLAVTWLHTQPELLGYKIAVNIQMMSSLAMLVQGLAVLYFFVDKYNLSKIVRGIILFLIFSTNLFNQMAIFAGLFDLVFDYRKMRIR